MTFDSDEWVPHAERHDPDTCGQPYGTTTAACTSRAGHSGSHLTSHAGSLIAWDEPKESKRRG